MEIQRTPTKRKRPRRLDKKKVVDINCSEDPFFSLVLTRIWGQNFHQIVAALRMRLVTAAKAPPP